VRPVLLVLGRLRRSLLGCAVELQVRPVYGQRESVEGLSVRRGCESLLLEV
jgi:hypothetical protein